MLTSPICCQQESLHPMCCRGSSVGFPTSYHNKASFLLLGKGNQQDICQQNPWVLQGKICAKIWRLIYQGEFCIPTINSGVAVIGYRTFPNFLSGSKPHFTFFSSLRVMNFRDRNSISKKARLWVQILFLRLPILLFSVLFMIQISHDT